MLALLHMHLTVKRTSAGHALPLTNDPSAFLPPCGPKQVPGKPTWDDLANSLKLSCTCLDDSTASCAADYE